MKSNRKKISYPILIALMFVVVSALALFITNKRTSYMNAIESVSPTDSVKNETPDITAYFKVKTSPTAIEALAQEVRALPGVSHVRVISSAEALEIYKKLRKDDRTLIELLGENNLLPASLEISLNDESQKSVIKDLLNATPIIDEVSVGKR